MTPWTVVLMAAAVIGVLWLVAEILALDRENDDPDDPGTEQG